MFLPSVLFPMADLVRASSITLGFSYPLYSIKLVPQSVFDVDGRRLSRCSPWCPAHKETGSTHPETCASPHDFLFPTQMSCHVRFLVIR